MNPVAPKRILMTADTVGGVWTYAMELCRQLSSLGTKIALATMGRRLEPDQAKEVGSIPNLLVYEGDYKLEWMNEPWADVASAGTWLLEIASEFGPDMIHVNGYAHSNLPWKRPVVCVAHSCVCSWWQAVHGNEPPPERRQYVATVQAGLMAADLVISPSEAMLVSLRRHYRKLPETRVIYNARTPLESVATKEPFVLAAGRLWDQAKNISTLSAISRSLDWPVFLAGEETMDGVELEGSSGLRMLGRMSSSQVRAQMKRAAIYALPARYEPFGLSILEAAQEGCALVLGDIPSLREFWGTAAIFVNPNRPEELEQALKGLIRDSGAREAWSAKAREAASRFSVAKMAAEYLSAYAQAARARTLRNHIGVPGLAAQVNDGPVPISIGRSSCES